MLAGLDAALERLAVTEPEATVKSASVAKPVGAYRNGRGGTILATTAGWVTYRIALLGLADGAAAHGQRALRPADGIERRARSRRIAGGCRPGQCATSRPGTMAAKRLTLRTVLDKRQDP